MLEINVGVLCKAWLTRLVYKTPMTNWTKKNTKKDVMVGVFNVGLVQIITLIKKKFLYVHKYANFNINHLKINACKYFKKEKKI